MVDGIYGIKDTYVVCKYVKKTLLELGFMGFRHLPAAEGHQTNHIEIDHPCGIQEGLKAGGEFDTQDGGD
jgi:hypothetical protein